jgi:DNA (cytosine-5)-methyltransferase 1
MQKFGATKPKRPLDPAHAHDGKEKKQRENWIRQMSKFPEGGTIPNLGDFTKITKDDYDGEIDLLVGGFPCCSFSVAGLRKGLDDPRGNLALEFARLAHRIGAKLFVAENVPGLLSSNQSKDFASFLSLLCGWEVEAPILRKKKNGDVVRGWKNSGIVTPAPGGYGVAWRTLDAQFVRVEPGFPRAVPQRRRRLFLVGSIGDWQYPAAVLFEPGCFNRNPEPRRQTGQGTARGFEVGPSGGRQSEVSATLDTKCKDGAVRNQTGMLCMAHGQGNAEVCADKSPTLNCNHEVPIICKCVRMREGCAGGGKGPLIGNEISHTLGTGNDQTIICLNNRPRELKATENISHPLKASDSREPPVICYENHPGDSRIKELKDGVCSQINARLGTGGGNSPLVLNLSEKTSPSVARSYGIAENIINRKEQNGGNGIGVQEELQYTLNTAGAHGVCCFVKNDAARDSSNDVAMTLRGQAEHAVSYQSTVRRLMPVECERLMGFPDNHTQIEWNGKSKEQCPDGPRYKACGNSFCVNCARWLGRRIQLAESMRRNAELKAEDKDAGE